VPNGVVYTRWGRYDCPGNGTELVYTGKNIDFVCILFWYEYSLNKELLIQLKS